MNNYRRPAVALATVMAALLCFATTASASTARARAGKAASVTHARARIAVSKKRKQAHKAVGTPVPGGFVGMDADGALFLSGDGLDLAQQFALMARHHVQTVRVAFSWQDAQPYQTWSDVPQDQQSRFTDVVINGTHIPMDFSETDEIVYLARFYGMRVLPDVMYVPNWDAQPNRYGLPTPADPNPYATYVTALIQRYGPNGTYWQQAGVSWHGRALRRWQIWNEPNYRYFWGQPASAASYVTLLRAAHAAIVKADPGAQTVLAAITNRSWQYLAKLYRIRGARSLFNVAAVNAFSSTPPRVITILRYDRKAMNAGGDRGKPMLATEVSWTSAKGWPWAGLDWDTTPTGQARNIAALLALLAANRRSLNLAGFNYYTWVGDQRHTRDQWNFAGLLRVGNGGQAIAKPALAAFTSAAYKIEH